MFPAAVQQRRVNSLHNITALGLGKRVNQVQEAYERVKNRDQVNTSTHSFKFDEKALRAAEQD